jgi:pimeloyl-ACP methyl ester carboxylesterase
MPPTVVERILTRNGCPIHYWLHEGDSSKPMIVFTHGAGVDHHMFDSQVSVLAGQFPLLTWDVRGHGLSRPMGSGYSIRGAVDDLLAILDELGVRQAIFAGQSMGGNISQEVVFLHPERVKALVLIDCACNTFQLSGLEKWILTVTPALLKLYPEGMLKNQSVKASAVKPDVQAYLAEVFSRMSKDEFTTVFLATAGCLHEEPNYRIEQPMLLVHGEHDGTGNIKKAAPLWAAREHQCRYVVIPDAGHMANMDNSTFFNQILLEFLQNL